MKYFKKIVGDNVYLSPISSEDLETFVSWMNDFGVTDYIGRSDMVVTLENEKEWIADATNGKKYIFAIVKLENDELLGTIELTNIRYTDRSATAGIFVGNNQERCKGYGTEALKLLVEYAFKYLNLHSVNLTVFAMNERAKRCYEKVGFKVMGKQRECRFIAGNYYDVYHMDLLENEFEGGFIKNKNV